MTTAMTFLDAPLSSLSGLVVVVVVSVVSDAVAL